MPDTIYIPLLKTFPDSEFKNYSDWVRKIAKKRLEDITQNGPKEEFPYDVMEDNLRRFIETKRKIERQLHDAQIDAHRTAFDVLCDFAEKLSGQKALCDYPKALTALHGYEYQGSEPFCLDDFELFIQLVEVVIEKAKLQEKLSFHRRQNGVSAERVVVVCPAS